MKRLLVAMLFLGLAAGANADLWINELHYDDTGTDVNEGFEIAGNAGTDLSQYTVWAYNGANYNTYDSLTLSGTLTDESGGFGFVWFGMAGLQNGSPDGLALYNDSTMTLIQFLSYEGSFAATAGVANGVTSEDIGVAEVPVVGDPQGLSLQLGGTGATYADFTWQGRQANTMDSLNTGQTTMIPEPTTVVCFVLGVGALLALRTRR